MIEPSAREQLQRIADRVGVSASGALRASIGTKIATNLVPYEAIAAIALGLNYGAVKYEPHNFKKGLSYTQLLESLKRHIAAIERHENIDADSGLPHWALICSSAAMLAHNIMQGVIIEDRPPFDPTKEHDVAEMALRFQTILRDAETHRAARADRKPA